MSFREIFVTLIIFCGTFFSAARILASDWQRVSYMPKVEHYRAAEQATECSVYRSVKEQSEQKISYNRKVLGESMRALELARRDLDACASSKGVSSTGGEKEVLIAEL